MEPLHPYIESFLTTVRAAGYTATPAGAPDSPTNLVVSLKLKRSAPQLFRVYVESRRDGRGKREQYGYVQLAHDPRIGAPRLIDWTTISTRASFDLKMNGAGAELAQLFR